MAKGGGNGMALLPPATHLGDPAAKDGSSATVYQTEPPLFKPFIPKIDRGSRGRGGEQFWHQCTLSHPFPPVVQGEASNC